MTHLNTKPNPGDIIIEDVTGKAPKRWRRTGSGKGVPFLPNATELMHSLKPRPGRIRRLAVAVWLKRTDGTFRCLRPFPPPTICR
jgi:hypothetical protein